MGEVCSKDLIPLHGLSDMCKGHRTSSTPTRDDYRIRKSPVGQQVSKKSPAGGDRKSAGIASRLPDPSQERANESIRLKLSMPYSPAAPAMPEEDTDWENECKRLIDRTLAQDKKSTEM
ncbi:hypothetical protein GUITHDRAFT_103769 [Guillardia theta CCMP2712]|uniref:Uncharacterized protein n=1 Tax=Guillardia theta (strain CCMP2712) TaxID=905079 RepID=L1JPM1_GUITC|nr:hypothetical protein GUITHDRAFT_103769 [Guillardia theta CCMP2712]EKX50541.1 hypothetical protein GUITHDRAFT_103769 [Guillardia theta CCMP2712]|eukprot:XP_005837521.1 hypothetical protein GUITHDRAFT_103769 [Guillardia theta CCMP2712]